MLIGGPVLGWAGVPNAAQVEALRSIDAAEVALEAAFAVLAELGLIQPLFIVGLKLRIAGLLALGRRATFVGLGGIVLPFAGAMGFWRSSAGKVPNF